MSEQNPSREPGRPIRIGWGQADITPDRPVLISGQFHARVSEGILDPISVTALALDAGDAGRVVMVSCDLVSIPDGLRDAARERICAEISELKPGDVFLNATHTHAAPEVRVESDADRTGGGNTPTRFGVPIEDLDVMGPADYVVFVAERIASAVAQAWRTRVPGGVGFGLSQAVVGRNRRISYYTGESRMYGKTDDPEFSHIEGYEDHDVNVLCTYDPDKNLTGLIINLACPSQVSEHEYRVSADFWHNTRVALRERLGEQLYILAQNGTSGDLSPHVLYNQRAEARMLRLKGFTDTTPETLNNNLGAPDALRREIAARISGAVLDAIPFIAREIDENPAFEHRTETVELSRRALSQADVDEAKTEGAVWKERYETLFRELEANPEKKKEPRWYVDSTRAYRRMKWYAGVADRFEMEKTNPRLPIEVHAVRVGGAVFATNPFEYYLDYGIQLKARSPAVQSFLVQHVGSGTYVPSPRAVAGKSYGAVPASTPVGAEGGRELVEHTLNMLNGFFAKEP